MKYVLSIACLLVFACWSQAELFKRASCHGTVAVTSCQGTTKSAACSGAKVSACVGVKTGCFGAVASVPRRVVTRTTVDACGNVTQTSRSRGAVLVAVPAPTVEAVPPPKKK